MTEHKIPKILPINFRDGSTVWLNSIDEKENEIPPVVRLEVRPSRQSKSRIVCYIPKPEEMQ